MRSAIFSATAFLFFVASHGDIAAQSSGSVTISSATAGAGIINVTVQYSTGTGWTSVGNVTVFAAKDGGTISSATSTTGQLTFKLEGVRTGTYAVWAVLEYWVTETMIVNNVPTPGAVKKYMYSEKKTVSITNQWEGNQNQLQALPHGTVNVTNQPVGSGGEISSNGTITNLDANWEVAYVEIYAAISTGGTSHTFKQTYSPPTSTTPVAWNVAISSLPAGTYTVYIITTLKKSGMNEYQQIMSGPFSATIT